jgi:hypothetical protein
MEKTKIGMKRERLEMERNYSMMLKQMQMAYLQVTLDEEQDGEKCIYCWKTGCGCSNNSIKNDPFLNLTEPMEVR